MGCDFCYSRRGSVYCENCARKHILETTVEVQVPIPSRLKVLDDYVKSVYMNDSLCDFLIITKDKLFPVHLVIVSAQCHYFKILTRGSFREASEKEVTIKDISASIMDDVLKYCYTGECRITKLNFRDLVLAASKLQNDLLLDLCVEEASKLVSEDNFWVLFALGKACGRQKLCDVATSFSSDNFDLISKNPNFVEIEYEDLLRVMTKLRIDSNTIFDQEYETLIYKSVVSWVEADEHSRMKYLRELLKFSRIKEIGNEFLAEELERLYIKNCQVNFEFAIEEKNSEESGDKEAIAKSGDIEAVEESGDKEAIEENEFIDY